MKKVVFISGKGGAGKTGIATSYFKLNTQDSIMVDCDVDASNCYLTLQTKEGTSTPFISGFKYAIDSKICTNCGKCSKICAFDAIKFIDNQWTINEYLCEGCGACTDICEVNAINQSRNYCGDIHHTTAYGAPFYYALLHPGEDNSGLLITELKRQAMTSPSFSEKKLMILDGPPGIGCPVIATLSGADIVVLVVEATHAGLADALNAVALIAERKIKRYAIINKGEVHPQIDEEIHTKLKEAGVEVLGTIPFKREFYELLQNKGFMVDIADQEISNKIKSILDKIL